LTQYEQNLTKWLVILMISQEIIPNYWKIKKVSQIGEVVTGGTPDTDVDEYWGGEIPWLRVSDIGGSLFISDSEDRITEKGLQEGSCSLLDEGSIIIATRATIGDVAIAGTSLATNQGFKSIEPNDNIDSKFLAYYIISLSDYLKSLGKGATFDEVNKTQIENLDIPVPPLDEQERIVEAVEEQLERVKKLQKSVQSVQQLSNEYEDSIIAYIFSNLNFDRKKPAKNLPEERDIPESWELTTLGDMAHFQNGNGFSKSQWEEEGKPIIRIQNLTGTGDSYNYFSGDVHKRYAVENGDILFSWSGTIDAFRWTGGDAWLNQHIYRVDVEDSVEKRYMFYLLKRCASILEKRKVGGTLQHIRKGDVTGLQVPLPPKKEQREIIEMLESIDFSTLEKGVTDTNELLTEYRESILSRAFQDTPEADL